VERSSETISATRYRVWIRWSDLFNLIKPVNLAVPACTIPGGFFALLVRDDESLNHDI
jgi:hypothetical protein